MKRLSADYRGMDVELRDAIHSPLNPISVGKISSASRLWLGLLTGVTGSVLWVAWAIATWATA